MKSFASSRFLSGVSPVWRAPASLLVWGGALGLTAWLAADLFWRFAAPRPVVFPVALESDAGRTAQAIAERHLMGETAAGAAPVNAPGRFSLFGVASGDQRQPGFAVLAVDGGPAQGVVVGQEVVPGVELVRVLADHVELRSAKGTQVVSLSSRTAAGAQPGAGPEMPPGTVVMGLPSAVRPPTTEGAMPPSAVGDPARSF